MEFMKSVVKCIVLFAWMQACNAWGEQPNTFQIASTPDWVEVREFDLTVAPPEDLISGGVFYRIVDDQIRVSRDGEQDYYFRIAQSVVNQQGLDDSSLIQIDFDPSYQSLFIHDISVVRNGQRSDRLATSDISVFNSEEDHARRIYNGTLTFNAILNDVTVGDTVDFSYTLVGSNPVYKGLFSASRTLAWSVPVQDQYHRVLWGKANPLHVKQDKGMFPLSEVQNGDYRDYRIHVNTTEPKRFSSQAPSWNLPYPKVYYTETNTWEQVNDWAMGLYQDLGSDNDVKDVAESIRNNGQSRRHQLALALRFVQENIRYIGIEIGDNSHLPTPAKDTLRLKYGDCKDKSVLLLALLQELGIEAHPVLVNSETGSILDQIIPALTRFDHVIVHAVVDGNSYWLDPTMSNQIGQLDAIYQPDFGYALVVRSGETSLTRMDTQGVTDVRATETYVIPETVTEPSQLNVKTRYRGAQAQSMLSYLQRDGIKSVGEQYLEYYQRSFPGTTSMQPIDVETDEASGWVTVSEYYQLSSPYTEEESRHAMYFYANDIRDQLTKPEDIDRNAPYARSFPKNIVNTIVLKFPNNNWDLSYDTFEEDNPYFSFRSSGVYENNTLTLTYQYSSKSDHVPAEELDIYLEARARARDNTSYQITKAKDNGADADVETTAESEALDADEEYILWYMVAMVALLLVMITDWRFSATSRQASGETWFQPVSQMKFYIVSALTFGLYCNYWIYRNWLLVDRQEQKGIWPIARAIFAVFWLYPLYDKLASHQGSVHATPRLFPRYVAVLLALLFFAMSVVANVTDTFAANAFVILAIPLVFVPFISYINRLYPAGSDSYKAGSRIGLRHICLSLMCLPLIVLTFGQSLNLMPANTVVEGDKLWSHDLAFMQRENILVEADVIEFFYSNAVFSIRDDGNGFTQTKVFSYWVDENGKVEKAIADFEDIKDIKVEYAKIDSENTTVTVVRQDDSDFLLYVSAAEKKDKIFIEALLERWNAARDSNATNGE